MKRKPVGRSHTAEESNLLFELANGYEVSVATGKYTKGGPDGLWEIAMGDLTIEQVERILDCVEALTDE